MVLARYFKIHGARLDLRLAFRSCRSLPSSYLPFVLLMPTTCLKLCEGFTGLGQDWARNCSRLVTLDDEINLDWIELNAIADAAGLLGRDQGGTGTQEGINDDVTSTSDIKEGVDQHCGRLGGRMILEATTGI